MVELLPLERTGKDAVKSKALYGRTMSRVWPPVLASVKVMLGFML